MTENELKSTMQDGLKMGKTVDELYALLQEFAKSGGGQQNAVRVLKEIRGAVAADEAMEDKVLDLLDYATGSCGVRNRIW
jgi:hypothetical protein